MILIPKEELEGLKFLGKGGSSIVYESRWKFQSAPVVVKIFNLDGKEHKDSFVKEASKACGLRHGGFPEVYGCFVQYCDHNLQGGIVMEKLDASLNEFLRQFPPPTLRERVTVLRDCVNLLFFLHSRGLVHGDIHAKNIMVNYGMHKNGKRKVEGKIIDLGLSQ